MTVEFILSAKNPVEVRTVSLNFSDLFAAGSTLVSVDWAVSVISGTDSNPSDLLSPGSAIVGNYAVRQIDGGIAGVIYRITVTGTADTGEVQAFQLKQAIVPLGIGGELHPIDSLLTSPPYPFEQLEGMGFSGSLQDGFLYPSVTDQLESLAFVPDFVEGVLRSILVDYQGLPEELTFTPDFVEGELRSILVDTTPLPEELAFTPEFRSGELKAILITTTPLPEELTFSPSFVSGTLS